MTFGYDKKAANVILLVIGKGGEQIASIQSETQCMIQFASGEQ